MYAAKRQISMLLIEIILLQDGRTSFEGRTLLEDEPLLEDMVDEPLFGGHRVCREIHILFV